jgi:hypothetical protein
MHHFNGNIQVFLQPCLPVLVVLANQLRLSFNGDDDAIPVLRFQGQPAGESCRCHARQGGKPAENF